MIKRINDILQMMRPISLAEMKAVKLMNRIDTKYVADNESVATILSLVNDCYFVQEIDGKRVADYDSVYYDTPDCNMYTIHHDRKLKRDKLRVRNYVDTGNFFCEVKHKNNKGRTKKERIEVGKQDFDEIKTNDAIRNFVEKELPQYDFNCLNKKLETRFDRITLVNREKTERITLDFNVSFHNFTNGVDGGLSPLVVMELKQDSRCNSIFGKTLFMLRIKPLRVSKYCIGMAMTDDLVRKNRFKKKMMKLNNIKENAFTDTNDAGL